MKSKFFLFFALLLCITGCITDNSTNSTFDELHRKVKHTLGPYYNCGPIMSNEVTTSLFFDVTGRNSPLPVSVSMGTFISPTEWTKRHQAATNFLAKILAEKDISKTTNQPYFAKQFTNSLDSLSMPSWHYKNIGIDVGFSEPDASYPGLNENIKAAEDVVKKVETCLESYQ